MDSQPPRSDSQPIIMYSNRHKPRDQVRCREEGGPRGSPPAGDPLVSLSPSFPDALAVLHPASGVPATGTYRSSCPAGRYRRRMSRIDPARLLDVAELLAEVRGWD